MQQSSLEAFAGLQVYDVLPSRQAAVLAALRRVGPLPNRLLALRLGWPINSVTPRVLELREAGLVVEVFVAPDPETGRSCSWWDAKNGKEGDAE